MALPIKNMYNSNLEEKLLVLFNEIDNNEPINFEKEILKKYLVAGNTYQALECAQKLYKDNMIGEWLITKIAYRHYIKMKNSNVSSRTINTLVQMYPKLEYIK